MKVPESLKQDWDVFRTLCPREIIDILESPKLTFYYYFNITRAMTALGFSDLSLYVTTEKYNVMSSNTKDFKEILDSLDNENLPKEYNGEYFVNMFIDNIQNMYLKQYFSSIAYFTYNT